MESLTITPIYAALLGLILLVLSVRVIAVVRAKGTNYGDGGNPEFTTVIRGQGNFIEYVPLALILIAFAEAGGTSGTWIHAMGATLVVARILHPLGLKTDPAPNPLRFIGTVATLIVLLASPVFVLINQLG